MKDELTFPPAFEEHLKEIIPNRDKEERERIKEALQFCHRIGISYLEIHNCGGPLSNEDVEFNTVDPQGLYSQLTPKVKACLQIYVWRLTNAKHPNYAYGAGGGYVCRVYFNPFTVEGKGYINVISTKKVSTFNLSEETTSEQ